MIKLEKRGKSGFDEDVLGDVPLRRCRCVEGSRSRQSAERGQVNERAYS